MPNPTLLRIAPLALVALAACTTSTPAEDDAPVVEPPFQFAMTTEVPVRATVTAGGRPLGGVLLHVRELNPDGTIGAVIVSAVTDETGNASGPCSIADGTEEVEVVVVKPGYRGDLDADFAKAMGAFAPAARFTRAPAELRDLSIELEKSEGGAP